MTDSQTQSSVRKQANKFHIVNLDVDVVILNKKVKQVQSAVVPDIWVSDGICFYPNSKNSLPYVMRRSPVGKNWKTYPSTIESTFDTYTEARNKLAATNSDIDTTDSQHEASAAVNEEGRPKRKKRKPTRQMSADESAEDSESSDSDLEDGDDDVQPAVPAGLCAEKNATCYVPPKSATAPDRQVFTVPLTVNDVRSSQQPTASINQSD
ncbi:hypothetical protein DAPPUDRAFT_326707 [Daphnia pulex]|uniref:Uncharacterized protein n=1 Tax=Daphnia pulex TaxID=6669 RepID=E9H8E1_DAPPU|nr:hypothetical protein DAPPUDRAFT_326707 [Daphnia pulex]|eukprot:EFX71965.1 hypothetical protein DAPPUDRAFT_326707 [Daphnia pulex]